MKRLYFRCDSAHLFSGGICPRDGTIPPGGHAVWKAAHDLVQSGRDLSLNALRAAGVADAQLDRVMIIEFGSEREVFDELQIAATQRNGTWEPRVEAVIFLQHYFGRPGYRPFPVEIAGEPGSGPHPPAPSPTEEERESQ